MSEIVESSDVLDGAPRIEGRRIGVHHIVVDALDGGMSPERIAAEYDLDVADVHRAMAYYWSVNRQVKDIAVSI